MDKVLALFRCSASISKSGEHGRLLVTLALKKADMGCSLEQAG